MVKSSSHLITCHFHFGRPISCGKFVFPSHYLPLPILDVPSPVVKSSSHLIACHFPSWTSHLLWYIRLLISLPAIFHIGRPISCGKIVFPSHYLPLFLEIRRFLSNLGKESHVICQKKMKNTCPLGRGRTPMSCVYNSKNMAKLIHKYHVTCQKTSDKSAAKSRVIFVYYIWENLGIYTGI